MCCLSTKPLMSLDEGLFRDIYALALWLSWNLDQYSQAIKTPLGEDHIHFQ